MMKAIATACAALATIMPTNCDPPSRTCPDYEPLLAEYAPSNGWDVARMSHIMYRESRCNPYAWNAYGHASGLLQVTPINYRYLRNALGEWVDRYTLTNPVQNIRASAALFEYWQRSGHTGYEPWRT